MEIEGPPGLTPFLPVSFPSLSRFRYSNPPEDKVTYHPCAFKLPLTSSQPGKASKSLCGPKENLPGYAIRDLMASYEKFHNGLHDIVRHSVTLAFQSEQFAHQNLFTQVWATVTHGAPLPSNVTLVDANHAAFVARLTQVLLSDVFLAFGSAIQLPGHLKFLKKHLPQFKSEFKMPKAAKPGVPPSAETLEESQKQVSGHLIFAAFDYLMSSPSNSTHVVEYLRPLIRHAVSTFIGIFKAHRLPEPDSKVVEVYIRDLLDWFLRLKREYPGVGFYFPIPERMFEATFATQEGGEPGHTLVAFTTCLGLWDGSFGTIGLPARSWTKHA
jgi:hypothetical protein